jgi:hypothetical protein
VVNTPIKFNISNETFTLQNINSSEVVLEAVHFCSVLILLNLSL